MCHEKIGFIGAGKVGKTLGCYYKKHGYEVGGYYSKIFKSAVEAAKLTHSVAYRSIEQFVEDIAIIFVTTTDDQIEVVDQQLAQLEGFDDKSIVIHTSGAHKSDILKNMSQKGIPVASMHPIQSFAQIEVAVKAIENTYFTIEGNDKALKWLSKLLDGLGNQYFVIDKEKKALYHAGACVMSNYLVTLMDYGLSLFESVGINKEDVFKAMLPLIKGTLENIESVGTIEALTGPIARGDIKTIASHIENGENSVADQMRLYKILGKKTIDIIEKRVDDYRIDNEQISELKKLLKS